MLLGLIEDGKRSRPSYTGQRAICPFCQGELIAKCGDIIINHWQHKPSPNCDTWKENEGEWHKEWKRHFPEKNQEVIVTIGTERHIADVKTDNGTVIEFQNSSISANTITVRENFYGNMIWVINAGHFIKNLKIQSVVKRELKLNEKAYANELYDSDMFYNEAIQGYNDGIKEWNKKKQLIQWKLDSENCNLKSCIEATFFFDDFYKELVDKLGSSALFEGSPLREVNEAISIELKQKYITCLTEIEKLSDDKFEAENWLDVFSKYPDFQSEQIEYKIIPSTIPISSDNFDNIYAILKDDVSSLFPNLIGFRNKADFERVKNNSKYYLMAKKVDFEVARKRKIVDLQYQIDQFIKLRKRLCDEVKIIAIKRLEITNRNCQKNVTELKDEIAECEQVISNIKESLNETEKSKISDHDKIIKSSEFKQKISDIEIMKKNKGLYVFQWKNERKSWKNSQKPIYFDIGEKYLFELYQEGCLMKIDKQTFINQFMN